MNVIIANKYRDALASLDIDIIKKLDGEFSVDEIIETFKNFKPYTEDQMKKFKKDREIIRETKQIPCTKCNYCKEVCPIKIPISQIFSVYNELLAAKVTKKETREKLKANYSVIADCIKCGKCETNCPQSIKIREELEKINKFIKD